MVDQELAHWLCLKIKQFIGMRSEACGSLSYARYETFSYYRTQADQCEIVFVFFN